MFLAKKVMTFVMDILETITFIGSIFVVIYLFIMQPNQVKGQSMDPTFNDKDYILTSKVSYKFRPPLHGDVVVFKSLSNEDVEFIKRVIGVPGDQILIQNAQVFVNNRPIEEDYIADKTFIPGQGEGYLREGVPVVVPPDHLFVLGDNRPHSLDSRYFGFVPMDNIIGVVVYRYFPPNKMGFVKNHLKNQFSLWGGKKVDLAYLVRS